MVLSLPLFLGATSFGDAPAKPAAQFEGKDTLLRAQGYREWVFVGSSVGLRFDEGKKAPKREPSEGRSARAAVSKQTESPGMAGPKYTRMEVRFVDDSTMKLTVVDPQIELRTSYGDLVIPMADIHQIDLGTRVTAEETKRAETLAARFASRRFSERAEASADLEALGYKAFAVLLRFVQGSDPEIARRSEALLTKLRNSLPADILEMPSYDNVVTEHSQIAGTIRAVSLQVKTFQFGDQVLKLADVRSLRALDTRESAADVSGVLPDPGNLQNYQQQVGKMFRFRVTGAVNGSVWGTGKYTTDSTLAVAAVHAGILKPGQTAIVRVKVIASPPVFTASTQHGVASAGYGTYGAAFEFGKGR
jgi:hypothetical protein